MKLSNFNRDVQWQGSSIGAPRLTYCTNIHAGEQWDVMHQSLTQCAPEIRQLLGLQELAIGLRLGETAVSALQNAQALEQLQALVDSGYPVFTVNAFPYGKFHGEPVKSNVYAPDWSTDERLQYTRSVAHLLAALNKPGSYCSISTVPGTFKPWLKGREEAILHNLLAAVAELVDIERDTGVVIALALEPEPFCMLETIDETIDWFLSSAFSASARQHLARRCHVSDADAEQLIRRHLGVCYDVCHAAVEFENPSASLVSLDRAGITIPKIQISSALRIAKVDQAALDALQKFDEPVYLHQVIQSGIGSEAGKLRRFVDLPEAMKQSADAMGQEWRIHFHVPVFIDKLEAFDTTQFFLEEVLKYYCQNPCSPHLEVETYTWDVLPEDLRSSTVSEAIAREMQWVADTLDKYRIA